MRLKQLLYTGIILPFLVSCEEPEPAKLVSGQVHFDVPGFIEEQLAVLQSQKPALQKTVSVRGEKPETRRIDTVNWPEELQYFGEIDLNKKALAGVYSVAEKNLPAGRKLIYTRLPEEKTPVSSLEILLDQANKVKSMRAVYEQRNGLFYNREIRFLQTNSQNHISTYHVSGVQKVLLFDSLHYAATGKIAAGNKL